MKAKWDDQLNDNLLRAMDCIDKIGKLKLCDHWCVSCGREIPGTEIYEIIRKFHYGEKV